MHAIPSEVVQRFALKNDLPRQQADNLFTELEAFLGKASDQFLSPTKEIDDAWHEFILHTQLYGEYCVSRFGEFIHHVPKMSSCDGFGSRASANCSKCTSRCAGCRKSLLPDCCSGNLDDGTSKYLPYGTTA
jgi:hypothetical protein